MDLKTLAIDAALDLAFVGPDLSHGPLPALIYFSLSKEESLTLDPFNQPVKVLPLERMRVFSLTIPGHGPDLDPRNAISLWADATRNGDDILTPFFDECARAIYYLLDHKIASSVAVAGLSRGAFVACHVAARCPEISSILGFAPLTKLFRAEEFSDLHTHPFVHKWNLSHLFEALSTRRIRFYIGNRDLRVGTQEALSFILKLADYAYEKRVRNPPFEMIIGPSIGYMGHGTSPEVFQQGAQWIQKELNL